jgi:integrase
MPRPPQRRLTVASIRSAKPGSHGDGGGLYLRVAKTPGLGRSWIYRFSFAGRVRELGLGPAAGLGAVSLADARGRADEMRRLVRSGVDPVAKRRADEAAARAAAQHGRIVGRTFRSVAEEYVAGHEKAWRSQIHAVQWSQSLRDYVYPAIGSLPVADVAKAHVIAVLKPIWLEKPETASRVRGRIESVLDFATAHGLRDETRANPARWKGNLEHALPRKTKVAQIEHFASLPYDHMPTLMTALAAETDPAALALRLLILTASRTEETLGAKIGEFCEGVWTVPASRMKNNRSHEVPLSKPALVVLKEAERLRQDHRPGAFVFQAPGTSRRLGRMAMWRLLQRLGYAGESSVHGMRSSFRVWAAEKTNVQPDIIEHALAHTVGSVVERSYQRSSLLERRRQLMEMWAEFLLSPTAGGAVVPMRRSS